jgi:hypothetical protein
MGTSTLTKALHPRRQQASMSGPCEKVVPKPYRTLIDLLHGTFKLKLFILLSHISRSCSTSVVLNAHSDILQCIAHYIFLYISRPASRCTPSQHSGSAVWSKQQHESTKVVVLIKQFNFGIPRFVLRYMLTLFKLVLRQYRPFGCFEHP